MEKTRVKAKAPKERKFVNLSFDCDDDTLKRLNELADLAAVTLSQAVSVILAMYILEVRVPAKSEVKSLKVPRSKKQLNKELFGLGEK